MKTISAVLVDDEQHGLDMLSWSISQYCPEIEVIKMFNDSAEAKDFLQAHDIDLLFLDIEMPGMNGFDLLDALNPINFEVVFTTAYDQFAIRAFKVSAFDYLLKPIEKGDLRRTVDKYQSKSKSSTGQDQLGLLRDLLQNQLSVRKVALPTFEGLEFVDTDEIIRFEADNNYTHVILNNRKILVSKTLKDVEGMVEGNGFIRVHYSHLINLNKVKKYIKGDGGYVVMEDDTHVNVSRSKKEAFIQVFTKR